MSKLAKRITALLLSGMLAIGSASGSVYAAAADVDPGLTSEVAEEVFTEEETSEATEVPAEFNQASEVAEEVFREEGTAENTETPVNPDQIPEAAPQEEAVTSYTVTLDANGGYFANEWDDSIGDYAQKAEVISKLVPVDGTVAAIPVFTDPDGQAMLFAGWSLERDGELVVQAEEEYIPVDNCVLYAVWRAEDAALVETEEQEVADEGTEQADSVQEFEVVYTAEETEDEVTSEGSPVEEDVVTEFTEDTSDVPVGAGETTQVEDISGASASTGDITEEAFGEEAEEVQYYTVTLDANGGFFENEWDDAIGEIVEQAEVVEKHIPVGGTVAAFPVFVDPDGRTMVFAGWSLERDGELMITGDEEYAPVDNCTLYAVWEVEDVTLGETGEQEAAEDNSEQSDGAQGAEEVENAITAEEGIVEEDTASEANTDSETENEQDITSDQEAENSDEEGIGENSSDSAVPEAETHPELNESLEEKENVREDAANSVVASGTCGDNLTWTLDDTGTLTISGTGEMDDYLRTDDTSKCAPWKNYIGYIKKVIIDNGVTSIGDTAFANCSDLISIEIPDTLISIGNGAFASCTNIKRIEMPDSCLELGLWPFNTCTSLEEVRISSNISQIPSATFYDCNKLSSVTISKSVTRIDDSAFSGCTSLSTIYFNGNAPTIASHAFTNVTATAYYPAGDPTWTEDVRQNYGGNITWEERNTASIDITSGTCGNNLTWTLDSEGVLTITGNGYMTNYEKESNKYAPWYDYRTEIKTIIFDDLVESVGTDAFYNCINLSKVYIGPSVKSIGSAAFKECDSLENVTIPSNVASIGFWAFSYCDNLKNVTICNGVKTIGSQAFSDCGSLEKIDIPDSVTSFGNGTFYKCYRLKKVVIGDGITNIGGSAFSRCTSLCELVIGKRVATIENIAFSQCNSLKKIQLPETINKLESHAFYNCSYIKEIHFEGSAPSFATDTFEGVTATAYYPANDPTWTEDVRQNYGGNITWVEWDPDIISLMPKNNEINTDHGIIPQVIFSKAMRLSGKGYISLYENNDIVETIEAVEGEHAVVYVDSLDENNITSTLTLTFQKRILPGKHYSISIDSKSLEYLEWSNDVSDFIGTGTFFEGINKTEWGFSTSSLDYMHFTNQAIKIPDYMYDFLFKPIKAWWYKRKSTGEKGTCFGWAYAVGAKKQNYYGVNGFGDALAQLVPKTENRYIHHTLLEYIQLAQLYQFSENQLEEEKRTKNQYFDIYNAICKHINGSGPIITIGVDDGKNGHQVYPIEIISETNEEILIKVLNCNKPDETFYDVLKFNKSDGKIIGFELGEYNKNISYNTVDDILDDVFVGRNVTASDKTKLVYSSYNIENDSINKIRVKNGESDESQLYWTEEESITQTVPNGTNIGITDGYTSIEATVDSDATINLNATDNVAHIEPVSEETTSYTLVYGNADEEGNIDEITILSEADKEGVETQQTEDGIIISSEGSNHVEVSDGDNTIGFETNDASVLVKTDGAITVYEDSNNDGSYTNAVEVIPIGKTKINENNTTINYSNNLTFNGNEIKAVETVAYGNISLAEGTDCTITYTDNINAGTATVTITGIGNYEGTVTKTFTINPTGIDTAEFSEIEPVTYTGKEQTPVPTVKVGEQTLTKDTDYTITYANNTNIGTATVTITGKRNYTGTVSKSFTISASSIANAAVTGISNKTYTGSALTQNPTVKVGDQTLKKDTDYTVSYANNTKVGTATVKITGKGNYTGAVSKTFKINGIPVSNATVSGISNKTYTGSAITQNPIVKVGDQTLKKGTDYTITYANNTKVGTATVKITGKGNYTGTISKTFKISRRSIAKATISGIVNKTYTGSAKTQNPTVKVGDKTLKKGTDYTVSYANNTNVGKATVTITGKGNYTSKKTATFKINKAAQSITAKAKASSVAVGKTTTVSITGTKGKKSYKSSNTAIATVTSAGKVTAKKVGTVKITATSAATSNYKAASKIVTIKVVPAATTSLTVANQVTGIKLTWKKVTGANGYKIYRGKTLIKTITSGNTVTFVDKKANTNGTKYVYKLVAKASTGDSTLSKTRGIYRVSRPAISSATNSASKKMTVKWGKNAKANGYQIQYSTDKTFKSGNKAVSITSASTVSRVIGSLTKGKTYYVRIRTYKTVGSAKYWSIWSAARSVKISK